MNYVVMWPQDEKQTHVVFLTHMAMRAWEALEELGDEKETALAEVVSVLPHCSWSLKRASFADVKKEIANKYEILSDCVG